MSTSSPPSDAAPPSTRLVLIRHGESNATVERRVCGHRTCSGLSLLGHEQADALAERLSRTGEIAADVLIASNFPRARETAEHLAPVWGLPVEVDPGLGEHDPGDSVDGMTFVDFIAAHPDWTWGGQDPYASGFPGGETIAAFHLRVGTAMSRIVREHVGRTIVIVCHGGVIDAVLRQMLRSPMTGAYELFTTNTSLTEFATARDGWRLVRYNDAAHLAGLPLATPPAQAPIAAAP